MNAITIASKELGGAAQVARSLGISAPAVHQWIAGSREVPPDRCPAIERATGGAVTVDQLRPDVRWHRGPDPDWPHPDGRPTIDVAAPKLDAQRAAA